MAASMADDLEADTADEASSALAACCRTMRMAVSHLKSTHQTPRPHFRGARPATVPAPIITSDLAEQHFGDGRALPMATWRRSAARLSPVGTRPSERPGRRELEDVVARVGGAMARITPSCRPRHRGVVHGGTIRAALAVALGIEAERVLGFAVDTAAVTRLDHLSQGTEAPPGALSRSTSIRTR